MGRNMAARLVQEYKGEKRFFDVLPSNIEVFPPQMRSDSLKSLAKDCDVIVTMLPATTHVKEALKGSLFPHAKKGTLFIDCSTIDPSISKELSEEAALQGHFMIDAPVHHI